MVGCARHGATTRLVTDRPFVRRTVSSYSGACFWWTGYDSICLTRHEAKKPIAVSVDSTGDMRRAIEAGRAPAAAAKMNARLGRVLEAQADLRPTLH